MEKRERANKEIFAGNNASGMSDHPWLVTMT